MFTYVATVLFISLFVMFYLGSALENPEDSYLKKPKPKRILLDNQELKFSDADKEFGKLTFSYQEPVSDELIKVVFKDLTKDKEYVFLDTNNIHNVLKQDTLYLVYANKVKKHDTVHGKLVKISPI